MRNLVQIERIPRSENIEIALEIYARVTDKLLPPQIPMQKMTGQIADNAVTPPDEPIPDCVTCGACCQYFILAPVFKSDITDAEHYYDVTVDESDFTIGRYLKRKEDGSCHALGGNIGEKVGCEIYETRPNNCRGFDAGCDRCHELRRMYRLEKQLTEEQVVAAIEKLDARVVDPEFGERIIGCLIQREEYENYVMNFGEDASSQKTIVVKHTIYAKLRNEITHEIHSYDSEQEFWIEDEFLGMTLSEAYERIRKEASEA